MEEVCRKLEKTRWIKNLIVIYLEDVKKYIKIYIILLTFAISCIIIICQYSISMSIEQYIQEQYNLINKDNHKHNSQILYNLIYAKNKYQLYDINQSLYLDVKQFVDNYICSLDSQDYGYDEISFEKIINIINILEIKQQISIIYSLRRLLYMRGYDIEEISKTIKKIERKIAWTDRHYFKTLLMWMSDSFYALLITLLVYLIVVAIVLLPAPIECFEFFEVKFINYSSSPFWNHIINTLTTITGNDNISPSIIPIGMKGILLYIIGMLLFYLLIANYALRKIENYITIK